MMHKRHVPLDFKIRKTLLPVTNLTCGIPCESLNNTPICEGVKPFLANFLIISHTSSVEVFNHDGGERRYGSAEDEIPFLH
jgi:hypothetical protein